MERQLFIQWDDLSPALEAARGKTGLEYLQALLAGELPAAPISALMGFGLVEVSDGLAIFAGEPGEQHFNPMGTVHGGFAATLLDSALGCAVHTILPVGMSYATAQLGIHFTRPILAGVGMMSCTGRVIHRGRKMATAEAQLSDSEGKIYAHATTSCFIFPLG